MPRINVVVFGRGNGESILVQLEANHWMVVDCFINPNTDEPAAISYLKSIGQKPENVIKTIIITHFHEDHVRGMKDLISLSNPNAKVCMPDALTTKEALNYYTTLDILNGYDELSKVRELCSIFEYMMSQKRFVIKLNQDKLIFENENHVVTALSPSDYDSQAAAQQFIAEVSKSGKAIPLSASKHTPNHFCIAINVENKNTKKSILLGGDLEICTNPSAGWNAAISSIKAPKKDSIQMFKVPHHGSETAYHQDTWDNYVEKDAIAMITTFGSCKLPRLEYVEQFKKYTQHVLCATKPKYNTKQVLNHHMARILAKTGSSIKATNITPVKAFGYIEGAHCSNDVSYLLYGDAMLL
jgi:beta-lactamase superfamily II metal-dependent hydrolase